MDVSSSRENLLTASHGGMAVACCEKCLAAVTVEEMRIYDNRGTVGSVRIERRNNWENASRYQLVDDWNRGGGRYDENEAHRRYLFNRLSGVLVVEAAIQKHQNDVRIDGMKIADFPLQLTHWAYALCR